jgi:hypothetical protein
MDDLMELEVELTLTIAELVDLIECGAVTTNTTGYEPPIIGELRTHFTQLVQGLNEAVQEV